MFDKWYIEYIGYEKYYKEVRKQFFTATNISPVHRFFLVECDTGITDSELVSVIKEISRKWGKFSKREPNPFCPYVYLHGLSDARLASVKKLLIENECYIWDGYEYKGAEFNPSALVRPINSFLGVRIKMVNKQNEIDSVLAMCQSAKAVYQFFMKEPFYNRQGLMGKEFQILRTCDVSKMI